MNIIFLGAPGSGKGTQANVVAGHLNIPAISTGEILRQEVSAQSDLGKTVKSYLDSGKLVPDEMVIRMIQNRIAESDCKNGFILDGFPRNLNQAVQLSEMLQETNRKIDVVFNFEVSDDILIKRILGRFSCGSCGAVYNRYFRIPKKEGFCDECESVNFVSRTDDSESVIRNRLAIHQNSIGDMLRFYQKNSLLISLDAVKEPPLIFDDIKKSISNL